MIQQERLNRIRSHLGERGCLSVADATGILGASPATVRRDFAALVRAGLAGQTRGGIKTNADVLGGMVPFALREVRNPHEKAIIARQATELIQPGDVVIVDGGTSTLQLAPYLARFPLRVITNSLRLAAVLGERRPDEQRLEVCVTGGYLYPQASLLIGPQARASIRNYHADWAFLSVGGLSAEGVFNTNELVVDVELAMIESADRVAILADHTKIGHRAMCRLCPLEQVDHLVTDAWPETEPALDVFRKAGIEVTVVNPAHAPGTR
jgi:DeoR/GlpR family transcriptional regulator of sugar metabolism